MERRSVSKRPRHGHRVSLYRAHQHDSGRIPGKETQTPRAHVRHAARLAPNWSDIRIWIGTAELKTELLLRDFLRWLLAK